MEDFKKCDLTFDDSELSVLVDALNYSFDKNQNTFIYICKDVYRIWKYCKGSYFKASNGEQYNSYTLLAQFGFDRVAVSRYKQCYENFIVDNETTLALAIPFKDFSPSKLFELLVLSKETAWELVAKGLIKPTMTVKQIREVIKSIKDGTDKAEKVIEKTTEDESSEETIPMAYDPTKHYDFDYFKDLSKQQLINNIWELQKEYERLKAKLPIPTKSKALKSLLVG